MANLTRKWRKWMAVSCSHGHLASPEALRAVLEFKKRFKPDTTIHLGDFVDLAALRKDGHVSGPDSAQSIKEDLMAGLGFLSDYSPTLIFIGNHEDRLYSLSRSPNAIISHAAGSVIGELNDEARKLKAKLIPYDNKSGWVKFGDTLFGHGFMHGEQAIRDHAETFGKCVIGHLHRVGEAPARRSDSAVAYCVGCLADIDCLTYAKTSRGRLAWNHGFAWGEYCDNATVVRLEKALPDGTWRLPL